MVNLIGAAIDQCANVSGAAETPGLVKQILADTQSNITLDQILHYIDSGHNVEKLASYYTELGNVVYNSLLNKQFPIVIGGDHSCAIGTWSGVAKYAANIKHSFGLIWLDAHMDSHTPQTTGTGNIHGMPLAALLGHGYQDFTQLLSKHPKCEPANVILIGVRSYEAEEHELLERLGVKIYYNLEVIERGFNTVFQEAWQNLTHKVDKIGLTIDIDGFDPEFAPGVGTCVPFGINFNDFMDTYARIDSGKLLALEIVEANPGMDKDNKTINCVMDIIATTLQFFK